MRHRDALARRSHRTLMRAAWKQVTDRRDARGREYQLAGLLQLLILGMASGARSLREVEVLGQDLYHRSRFRLSGAPSDTTLDRTVRWVCAIELGKVLASIVHQMQRSKQLEVDPEIGISLVAIDGKRYGTSREKEHPEAVVGGSEDRTYYQVHALRAVLVSCAVKPALAQQVVRRSIHEGESTAFPSFVDRLLETYGGLVECISVDAGFLSMPNLLRLNMQGVGYIVALKGNARRVKAWAQRNLGKEEADPPQGWQAQRTDGRGTSREMTRSFARVRAEGLRGIGWHGVASEVWRVRQVGLRDGKRVLEDRYFLTNLPPGRLRGSQALAAVRAHWGIENACNWTLDTQLAEDSVTWVHKDNGPDVLAVLRLIAYNLLQMCRHRVLRTAKNRAATWRTLMIWIRDALVNPVDVWEPDGIG